MTEKHLQAIPPEVMQELKRKTQELNELLRPYALALTPKERHDIPKMGEKTVSFVEKALGFASENTELCPPYLSIANFEVDLSDALGLRVASNTTTQVLETISDIELLAGSEAFQAALAFYNYVKLLASQDVPRAKAIYEELKKRFPFVRRKKATNED
jgi:hypothetical protein